MVDLSGLGYFRGTGSPIHLIIQPLLRIVLGTTVPKTTDCLVTLTCYLSLPAEAHIQNAT